jgi:hypothetical protein
MLEVTLICPRGIDQFALGLDDDIRFMGQLSYGGTAVCFGAETIGDAYSIGARRGGGTYIIGEDKLVPFWPRWPHRADIYPEFEAIFWGVPHAGSAHDLAEQVLHGPSVIGLGVGVTDAYPVVLVELADDSAEVLDAAIGRLPLGPWMGGKVMRSLTRAPEMQR